MSELNAEGIEIRWTAVPSGVVRGREGRELRLKVVVAPRIPKAANETDAVRALFEDWPELVRRELSSFRVFVGGREGEALAEFDARVESSGLVPAGVWLKAFPSLAVRPENGNPRPDPLRVSDGLGSSYDPIRTEEQLKAQRALTLIHSLLPANTPESFADRAAFQNIVSMSESATSILRPAEFGSWAQVPNDLGVRGALAAKRTESDQKLIDRNHYRLAANGQLREGLDQFLGMSFAERNAPGIQYNALGSSAIQDCVVFNSRVSPLSENVSAPAASNEPDFAERMGLVRQFPDLAENLGLTLEVRVPLDKVVANATVRAASGKLGALRAWVVPHWERTEVISRSPGTLFDLNLDRENQELFATSEAGPGGVGEDEEHKDGYLLLRPERWSLSTLDVDGTSIKMVNTAISRSEVTPQFLTDLDGRVLHMNFGASRLFEHVAAVSDGEKAAASSFLDQSNVTEVIQTLIRAGQPQSPVTRVLTPKRSGLSKLLEKINIQAHLEYFGSPERAVCVWKVVPPGGTLPQDSNNTPASRSPGLALVRSDADRSMHKSEKQMDQLYDQAAKPGMPILVASDLLLGYVPELWAPPAHDPNAKPRWHSLTQRDETFPLLGGQTVRRHGVVSVAVGESVDAAPADQNDAQPLRQGNVSPSLFVYANNSLGAPNRFHSFGLPETDLVPTRNPDSLRVELTAVPGTLPLVRFSSLSKAPFHYAVRCRYVDLVGNTRALPLANQFDLGPKSIRLETLVTRHEPISPPRVLTDGRLDLIANPGATLKVMVARDTAVCDTRMLIPPKVSADLALRYGKLIDGNLGAGHWPWIQLDQFAEVPKEPCVQPQGTTRPLETPVFRWAHNVPKQSGYYYFPDPACQYATLTLHTFYSSAMNLDPIRLRVPFYWNYRWPYAYPIRINLCSLQAGEVEPIMSASGTRVDIFLPAGWVGWLDISASCEDHAETGMFRNHFAALELFEAPDMADAFFKMMLGREAGAEAQATLRKSATPDDAKRPTELFSLLQSLSSEDMQQKIQEIFAPLAVSYQTRGMHKEQAADLLRVTTKHFAGVLRAFGSLDPQRTNVRHLLSGTVPAVTPSDRIELVCATNKPLVVPTLAVNGITTQGTQPRPENAENLELHFDSMVDKKSTGEIWVGASWMRLQDDPTLGDPKTVWDRIQLPSVQTDPPKTYEPTRVSWSHLLDLSTTAYRRVHYRINALTRFAQYYSEQSKEALTLSAKDEVQVDHLSSARPRRPKVEYLVPTLTWTSQVRPHANKPKWRFETSAKYGIRVYLGRGWELGELMGVIALPTLSQHEAEELNAGRYPVVDPVSTVPSELLGSVSEWGADPIVRTNIPAELPSAADFVGFRHVGADLQLPQPGAATSETASGGAPRGAAQGAASCQRAVSVVGFEPQWHKERQLWYCDVGLRRVPSYGCFIRLAICRYQPMSIKGLELSGPVLADFMQLRSGRILSVVRDPRDRTERTLRVTVSEPASDGKTPRQTKVGDSTISNEFEIHVEQPCATEGGTSVGWIVDETITPSKETMADGDILWSATLVWKQPTGRRRLVVRELERWSYVVVLENGNRQYRDREREVFSAVLEV